VVVRKGKDSERHLGLVYKFDGLYDLTAVPVGNTQREVHDRASERNLLFR
jgi:hypothetical protein